MKIYQLYGSSTIHILRGCIMMKKISVLLGLAVFIASHAGADLIRVEVTGHVTEIPYGYYDDTAGQYPLVNIGDTMTGYCIYDTGNPDIDPAGYTGEYVLEEIFMQVGAYTFTTGTHTSGLPTFRTWVGDETYRADCPANMDIYVNSVYETWGGQFKLLDLCNASIGRLDDSFPTSFPDDISYYYYRNEFTVAGNFINITGTLDTINAVVVPEPATLLLIGLGGFLIRRKR